MLLSSKYAKGIDNYPMKICPVTVMTTVKAAPSRGNNSKLPVRKQTPSKTTYKPCVIKRSLLSMYDM